MNALAEKQDAYLHALIEESRESLEKEKIGIIQQIEKDFEYLLSKVPEKDKKELMSKKRKMISDQEKIYLNALKELDDFNFSI